MPVDVSKRERMFEKRGELTCVLEIIRMLSERHSAGGTSSIPTYNTHTPPRIDYTYVRILKHSYQSSLL